MKTFIGVVLGVVGWIIVNDARDEYRRQQRRNEPRWTDAARWEKPGRDY